MKDNLIFTAILLFLIIMGILVGCGIDAKVAPTIQVIPSAVLDPAPYCQSLPPGNWVLVEKL